MEEAGFKKANSGHVSHGFKILAFLLLFALIAVRVLYDKSPEILPDKLLLFIAVWLIGYLWWQELRDYYNLLRLHASLEKSYEQLKRSEVDTIATLAKALEAKDRYTSGHSERVTNIALAIAEEMKLAGRQKDIIVRSGMLHDIGKIGLSDSILNKKEKLTEDEWRFIKVHPLKAFEMLKPLKFLSAVRDAIVSHHENYDGSGYPYGLKGKEIPVEAMILAVADAFDAMNSKRAYREPLVKKDIINELNRLRGTKYAPEVIDAFFALVEKNPSLWQRGGGESGT
jgi:putative nucleotidyltransferase with HDIG domain